MYIQYMLRTILSDQIVLIRNTEIPPGGKVVKGIYTTAGGANNLNINNKVRKGLPTITKSRSYKI